MGIIQTLTPIIFIITVPKSFFFFVKENALCWFLSGCELHEFKLTNELKITPDSADYEIVRGGPSSCTSHIKHLQLSYKY